MQCKFHIYARPVTGLEALLGYVTSCYATAVTLMILISVCYSSELCSAVDIFVEDVIFHQAKSIYVFPMAEQAIELLLAKFKIELLRKRAIALRKSIQ